MTDADNHIFQAIGKLQGTTESLIVDLQQLRKELQDGQFRQGERVGKLEQDFNELSQKFAAHEAKHCKNGNGNGNGNGRVWQNPKVQMGGVGVGGVLAGMLIDFLKELLSK